LSEHGNLYPTIALFQRLVDECRKSFVDARNGSVLLVEPSGVPVQDGLV
jgi:hypothetical protein